MSMKTYQPIQEEGSKQDSLPWLSIGLLVISQVALNAFVYWVAKPAFRNPIDDVAVIGFEPYLVMNCVATAMVLMALGLPADLLLFCISSMFCVVGIISVKDLLDGLGNSGVVAVASLCIVSKAIDKTQALSSLMGACLGKPSRLWVAMLRLALPVLGFGCVFNNTPLVAVMIPIVQKWARDAKLPCSYLMMPLSFITMLSACMTTMGSSTNLLAVQLVPEAQIRFLDLAPAGAVIAAVGLVYCCFLAPMLLPGTAELAQEESTPTLATEEAENEEEVLLPQADRYTVFFKANDGPLLGRTLRDSGLLTALPAPATVRSQKSATDRISSGDEFAAVNVTAGDIASLSAVPGISIDAAGDPFMSAWHLCRRQMSYSMEATRTSLISLPVRRWVASSVEGGWEHSVRALYEVVVPIHGLQKGRSQPSVREQHRLDPEAVVGGRRRPSVGEPGLRELQEVLSMHGATLISVLGHDPVRTNFNVQGGDFLLLQASDKRFEERTRGVFKRIYRVADGHPPLNLQLSLLDPLRPALSVLGLAICVGFSACQVAPLDPTAILVSLFAVAIGTLTPKEVYGAINGPVLLTVAGSFGVGTAFEKTGLASCLASAVLGCVEGCGDFAVLGAIVVLALSLGVIVSNNTTVILLSPMIRDICERQNMDLKMATIAVIYAANLSFATPFSYQTNMMVMPHGGYVFMDYVRFGVPMMILNGLAAVVATYLIWA